LITGIPATREPAYGMGCSLEYLNLLYVLPSIAIPIAADNNIPASSYVQYVAFSEVTVGGF